MVKKTTPAKSNKPKAAVKKSRKPKLTTKDYHAVIRAANLKKIALRGSHFDINNAYFNTPEKKRKFGYDHKWTEIVYDPEKGVAGGVIEWSIGVQTGRKKGLKARISYIVIYDGFDEVHKEHAVRKFVKRVGRVATYSYFRSHIAQLNWESEADLPVMPVLSSL